MNKTIALLILGVILLAMGLIMVNQYMTQTDDSAAVSGFSAPVTTAPPLPQTPETALSQLEQRAASSELAPKEGGTPVSPPMPQAMPPAMPAWATNGATQTPTENASSLGHRPAEPMSQASTTAPSATPATSSPVVDTPAKKTAPSPDQRTAPAKAESRAPEQVKPKPEQPKVEQVKPKPKGPKTITKIVVLRMDDQVAVRVEGSEALEYKTMHLNGPERVVVDLEGQWIIKAPGVPDNKHVSNVRIGKQSDTTRIVIDLHQPPQSVRYVKRGAEGLDVRIK